jgi:hypothetical protein
MERQVGRLARKDVEIHHEPESWTVEARQGGPEGEAKRWAAGSKDEAVKMAEQLMCTDERCMRWSKRRGRTIEQWPASN